MTTLEHLSKHFTNEQLDIIADWARIELDQLGSELYVLTPPRHSYKQCFVVRISRSFHNALVSVTDVGSSVARVRQTPSQAAITILDLLVERKGAQFVGSVEIRDQELRNANLEAITLRSADQYLAALSAAVHIAVAQKVVAHPQLMRESRLAQEFDGWVPQGLPSLYRLGELSPAGDFSYQSLVEFSAARVARDEEAREELLTLDEETMLTLLPHKRGDHEARSRLFKRQGRWACECEPSQVALIGD